MGAKFRKDIASKIGEKIRLCRLEKNFSQAQLAKKVGVVPSQISKWESGDLIPRADKLLELDHELNIMSKILLECDKLVTKKPEMDVQQQISHLLSEIAFLRKEVTELKSNSRI